MHKIVLAQIVGQTIWRFSECLIIKWNPSYFNKAVSEALKSINNTELLEVKGMKYNNTLISITFNKIEPPPFFLEKMQQTVDKLLTSIKVFNKKIDAIDNIKYVIFTSLIHIATFQKYKEFFFSVTVPLTQEY